MYYIVYYQAETAVIVGDVTLAEGVSVWHQAVIRADEAPVYVDEATNIQDGVVMHVDENYPIHIGKRCTIGHRAIVHGCHIEDDVLIGMGAIVLNGARIGAGSIVGAGAVVLENAVIPPRSLVVGTPGKVRREIGDAQFQEISSNALAYVEQARKQLHKKEQDR